MPGAGRASTRGFVERTRAVRAGCGRREPLLDERGEGAVPVVVLVEPFDERIRPYGMQGVDDALALDLRWIARIGEGGDERPFGQEGPLWL